MAKLFVKRLDTKTATKGAYFKGCTKRKYTPPTHTHTHTILHWFCSLQS